MKLAILDSNIFVAAVLKEEPSFLICRNLLLNLEMKDYLVLEPITVLIEVVAAIRRRTRSEELAKDMLENFLKSRVRFLPLFFNDGRKSAEFASRNSVRGMDAILLSFASEIKAELITLDKELLDNFPALAISPKNYKF